MLRLFNGRLGQETPELRWIRDRPELLQLTLSAFRLAVKVAIDCAAMEEEVDMDYEAFAELAPQLRASCFLGVEGSEEWEQAIRERFPSCMTLRGQRMEAL